jgi:hypothetical protein
LFDIDLQAGRRDSRSAQQQRSAARRRDCAYDEIAASDAAALSRRSVPALLSTVDDNYRVRQRADVQWRIKDER